METNVIHQGDSLSVLKELKEGSIDLIASDPPYQLSSITKPRTDQTLEGSYGKEVPFSRQQSRIKGFMGKEWDVLPEVSLLKECLRVMKSGSFAFWLMTPRQDSQAEFISRLKEAGFVISFSPIYWTYASGFPKATNISKMVDKKLGMERSKVPATGGLGGGTGNTVGSFTGECVDENPISQQAKELDGSYSGFQPKPAVEVIIVSMKPLSEKTYFAQALNNRKGITWLDSVRIPYESENKWHRDRRFDDSQVKDYCEKDSMGLKNIESYGNNKGRFPANLLVSDDVLNDGQKQSQGHWSKSKVTGFGEFGGGTQEYFGVGDKGTVDSFSRYFDIDKWFEERIKELPESAQKTFPFLIVPKASSGEKNEDLEEFEEINSPTMGEGIGIKEAQDITKKNIHPTVKPIKIMSYLITLGSREGDIVLDPFIGSGTTAIASRKLTRRFIGIERDEEYYKIALARIKKELEQTKLTEI